MSDSALGDGSSSFGPSGIWSSVESSAQQILSSATDALTRQIDKGSSPQPVAYSPPVNTVPLTLSRQTKQILFWGAGAVGVLVILKILKVF